MPYCESIYVPDMEILREKAIARWRERHLKNLQSEVDRVATALEAGEDAVTSEERVAYLFQRFHYQVEEGDLPGSWKIELNPPRWRG